MKIELGSKTTLAGMILGAIASTAGEMSKARNKNKVNITNAIGNVTVGTAVGGIFGYAFETIYGLYEMGREATEDVEVID